MSDTGVVDENIHRAQFPADSIKHPFDLRAVGNIRLYGKCFDAEGFDLFDKRERLCFTATVIQRHIIARLCKG